MNLVKAYDLATSLKIPQLIPYSNGSNPEVLPPYVALAEIQAQDAANKRLAAAEGASTGDMPSIKEKYEQAAGLMALQGQQQQQAQQQMTSQIAQEPQAVPQGVPQPQQQPTPPMMAEGGLARLSVNPRMFDYRAGGIISFQSQGAIPEADPGENLDAVKAQAEQAIARLQRYGTNQQRVDPEGYKQALAAVENAKKAIQQAQTSYEASMSASGMDKPYIAPQKPFRISAPVQNQAAPPEAGDMGARDRGLASLPTAQPAPRPAPAARPVTPTGQSAPPAAPQAAPPATSPGLPAALPSKLEQMQMAALEERTPNPTVADAQADYKAATPEALRQPAGLEQLARLKLQQGQYDESQKDRAFERLMKVLGAGGRGGMGGFGSGYLGAVEGERASDAAQSAYQDKVMTAIEATRRGEATAEQKSVLEKLDAARTRKSDSDRTRSSNITSARSAESQRESANLDRASREKEADLDRKLRVQLNNTPPAQRATVEENAIRDYMVQLGIPYSQAYEKVKQLGGDIKGGMTLDKATDNAAKIMEDGMFVREIQKKAKDAGQPIPDRATIRKKLIDDQMNYKAPSTAPSPTMPADRAAQFKVIR
jgi:hypothetical protein